MSAAPPPDSPHRQHGNVLAIAAFMAVCLSLIWLGWGILSPMSRRFSFSIRVYPAPAPASSPTPASRFPAATPPQPPPPLKLQPTPEIGEPAPNSPPKLEVQTGQLPWELQIDTFLARSIPEQEKAAWLLAQVRSMPTEAFPRLAQEATDRLPDRYYSSVALPTLLDPQTHGSVESVLFTDLLERPDSIALPALLSLARTPGHPFAESARESLALLLGDNFGSDWAQWERAVADALATSTQR